MLKRLCCFILCRTCDNYQDSLINKTFIQNINFVFQYALLFKSLGKVFYFYFIFLRKQYFYLGGCVKLIKGDRKDLYCEKKNLF